MFVRFSIAVFFAIVVSASAARCECTIRCVRKEIRTLSREEVSNFTTALLQLNQRPGNYYNEHYPITHFNFVNEPPIGADVHDTNFLPWHRYFLRQLEIDLQAINPSICLPYWNWTLDYAFPAAAPVFRTDYFGSGAHSRESAGECVPNGPFTYENGWHIPQFTPYFDNYCSPNYGLNFSCEELPGTTCLTRNYYGDPTPTPTPTPTPGAADDPFIGIPNGHGCIIAAPSYLPPYSLVEALLQSSDSYMFWSNSVFCTVHNSVHRFLGGQMASLISPSDPLFFLHHGYLDVIFSQWQEKWNLSYSGNTYLGGHLVPVNSSDILFPFGYSADVGLTESPITVGAVWDIQDLCYTYQI